MRFEMIAQAVVRVFANVAKHVDVARMAVRIDLLSTRRRRLCLTRPGTHPSGAHPGLQRLMASCPWQRQRALCPVRVTERGA